MDNLKELLTKNIWTALDDYFRHSYDTEVFDDISNAFVDRLAEDAVKSKHELRELFRLSNSWDEQLQAIVINGSKTHNPDYILLHELANSILRPAKWDADCDKLCLIERAVSFFSRPNDKDDSYIQAINELAPYAYAPHKKRSRIFKALCDSLGVSDLSAGSEFQRLFAQFADELSTRKIDFKLFLSINPCHFLTMSNPKGDKRGSSLTSCHSFNVPDGEYNCGCSGYARDKVTFIVFTAADPDIPETLNNRKTSRQLFMYKPNNGLLLQSRLYNTHGGTCGTQADSNLYRDLVQRELSELEDVPNLWLTERYCGNNHDVYIRSGNGFGGYADWPHPDFNAKISIRHDHFHDFKPFDVGTYGLCISCGCETSEGLYCSDCDPDEREFCQECDQSCYETWEVIDYRGNFIQVCGDCLERYYRYCDHCEQYHPRSEFTLTGDGSHVCHACLEDDFILCDQCGKFFPADDVLSAVNSKGDSVFVCSRCREDHYATCSDCDELVHLDALVDELCPHCLVQKEASA